MGKVQRVGIEIGETAKEALQAATVGIIGGSAFVTAFKLLQFTLALFGIESNR